MKRTLLVFLLVNLMLSACAPVSVPTSAPAPSATPLPTATAAPTITPTATPTATPTPIPTIQVGNLSVPDPRVTNPELFDLRNPNAPIPQFVNAMKMAGIEITAEQVAQGLKYEARQTLQGTVVFGAYNIPPDVLQEKYLSLAPSYCLLIGEKKEKGWGWKAATPGRYWEIHGKLIGLSMNGPEWKLDGAQALVKQHFAGGILGLKGQVRPGPDIEERRPSNASSYLGFAQQNNMAFMFNSVVEPGKFPKDVNANNVDQWINRRLAEIADAILQDRPIKPVYLQFNEAFDASRYRWNPDPNPMRDKYGDNWLGEYFYQALSVLIGKGLIPDKDFILLTNENLMDKNEAQKFVHEKLIIARQFAFDKLISDPNMSNRIAQLRINSPSDITVVLGSQTYVNLDGKYHPIVDFVPNPTTSNWVGQLSTAFADLGGIILIEVNPYGDNSQRREFLWRLTKMVLADPNIHGALLWNVFSDPDDAKDPYAQSPLLLFNENGSPTSVYYSLLYFPNH